MTTLAGWLVVVVVAVYVGSQTVQGQNTYVITFPCTVLPGQDAIVGVSLFGARADVTIFAELQPVSSSNTLSATSATVAMGTVGQVRVPTPITVTGTTLKLIVRGSGGLSFVNQTTVSVGKAFSLFVQTDKGAYRPGQTVRMRVVSVLPTLRPYTGKIDVSVEDNDKNRLGQWLQVQPTNGIWSEDFPISDYPPLGNWTIKVAATGAAASAKFEVREYVLPKFSVTVSPVAYIAKEDNTPITATVSAQYTYGKPVHGTVSVNMVLNKVYQSCYRRQAPVSSIVRTVSLSSAGVGTIHVARADFLRLFCSETGFFYSFSGYQQLLVNATVVDQVSGERQSGVSTVGLYGYRQVLSFDKSVTPSSFKPGVRFPIRLLLSTPDKKPIDNTAVTVEVSGTGVKASTSTLMSQNGVINHVLVIPRTTSYLRIVAYPGSSSSSISHFRKVYHNPSRVFSPSKSYLQLSSSKANFAPGETATFTAIASVDSSAVFTRLFYQVFSRATLLDQGSTAPTTAGSTSATFTVPIREAMGPYAKVVAYFLYKEEFVVDSLSVSIADVFENNVTLSFGTSQARPNDNVTLTVSARSGSTVAVSVVDQSALLVGQANTVSVDGVIDALLSYDPSGRPITYDGPVWALQEPAVFRRRRTVLPGPWYYGGVAAKQVLANSGVCTLTDFYVPSSSPSYWFNSSPGGGAIPEIQQDIALFSSSGNSQTVSVGQSLAVADHTRNFFPETWLWESGVAGPGGIAEFDGVVPDSITSWVATAFAVSTTSGLGVAASSAKLRAFQNFFVSLNLPYSVIRGEELVLQVNVFNYLTTTQEAVVSLEASSSLLVTGVGLSGTARRTISIPAGEAQSALFVVTPQMVGQIPITVTAQSTAAADRVVRRLLVESEGITKSYSRGVFIDLSGSSTSLQDTLALSLPEGFIVGSARAVVSVIGDIMGPALSNLDKLLKMPYGCGEQNMLGFAPDVFITRYLTATRQTSPAILSKAKRFMMSGYQRELRYWRRDYSFSAFGNRDSSGSLWLTAFVVKSFSQATPYIYVDPQVIDKSLRHVIGQQTSSGSFPLVGLVHHQGMKGGLQGDVARTAYILSALVEAKNYNIQLTSTRQLDSAIASAQSYLASKLTLVTDNYTLALSAYSLKLSNSPQADQALQLLLARADRSGGTVYWRDSRQKTVSSRWTPPWRKAQSADVELTAYALLALVLHNNIADGAKVARWLVGQRNSRGSFDSTQDTVVGLQALAEFATLVAASPPTMSIQISSQQAASSFSQSFSIDSSNSLVLQQTTEFPVPGRLALSASGTGTSILSVEVFYNIKRDDVNTYDMTNKCDLWRFGERLGATCRHCTHVAAEQYANTGMSLLEIGLPSGFVADMPSLDKALAAAPAAGRVETPDRQVVFYIDEIGSGDVCFEFDILQSIIIGRLQPSATRTINYYNPSISNAALYSLSLQEIPLCCQCLQCDGCSSYSNSSCPVIPARPSASSSGARLSLITPLLACLLSFVLL